MSREDNHTLDAVFLFEGTIIIEELESYKNESIPRVVERLNDSDELKTKLTEDLNHVFFNGEYGDPKLVELTFQEGSIDFLGSIEVWDLLQVLATAEGVIALSNRIRKVVTRTIRTHIQNSIGSGRLHIKLSVSGVPVTRQAKDKTEKSHLSRRVIQEDCNCEDRVEHKRIWLSFAKVILTVILLLIGLGVIMERYNQNGLELAKMNLADTTQMDSKAGQQAGINNTTLEKINNSIGFLDKTLKDFVKSGTDIDITIKESDYGGQSEGSLETNSEERILKELEDLVEKGNLAIDKLQQLVDAYSKEESISSVVSKPLAPLDSVSIEANNDYRLRIQFENPSDSLIQVRIVPENKKLNIWSDKNYGRSKTDTTWTPKNEKLSTYWIRFADQNDSLIQVASKLTNYKVGVNEIEIIGLSKDLGQKLKRFQFTIRFFKRKDADDDLSN